jgi:hypothetical protein
MPTIRTHARRLVLMLGVLSSAACGVARFGRIPGVMRGVTWTCADSSTDIARRLRIAAAADIARQNATRGIGGSDPPKTDATSVITDAAICRQAGRAYARETGQRLAPGAYQTAVIATGDRYVVRSVTAPAPAGEWNMTLVFDFHFHAINGILAF